MHHREAQANGQIGGEEAVRHGLPPELLGDHLDGRHLWRSVMDGFGVLPPTEAVS